MTLENPPAVDPSLVSRVKYILTRPKFEWPVIDAESASIKGLFTNYAVILAAIPAVATIVGQIAFGHRGLVGPVLAGALDYAQQHQEVIARFGRFPHRNAILGRESSAEEKAYLAQPGSGF